MRRIKSIFYFIILMGFLSFQGSVYSKKKADLNYLFLETPSEASAGDYDTEEDFKNAKAISTESAPIRQKVYFREEDVEGIKKRRIHINMTDFEKPDKKDNLRDKIASAAKEFLEKNITSVKVNGYSLPIQTDCTYFIRAVYWRATDESLDLLQESVDSGAANTNSHSGVEIIYDLFAKKKNFDKKTPETGDVIFFDDTWDRNNNRKIDDALTHVGIVVSVDSMGTVEFVHGNAGKKIKKGYLNKNYPDDYMKDGKVINTYLRRKYAWEGDAKIHRLSGGLTRGFGRL